MESVYAMKKGVFSTFFCYVLVPRRKEVVYIIEKEGNVKIIFSNYIFSSSVLAHPSSNQAIRRPIYVIDGRKGRPESIILNLLTLIPEFQ